MAGKPAWVLLNAVPPQGKLGEEAQNALRESKVQVVEPGEKRKIVYQSNDIGLLGRAAALTNH